MCSGYKLLGTLPPVCGVASHFAVYLVYFFSNLYSEAGAGAPSCEIESCTPADEHQESPSHVLSGDFQKTLIILMRINLSIFSIMTLSVDVSSVGPGTVPRSQICCLVFSCQVLEEAID